MTGNSTWNCDTCVADIQAVSKLMDSAEAGTALAHHLQGHAFCKADDLGLTAQQAHVCAQYVEAGAVKGFQYIFKLVGQYALDICTDNYEVCEAKKPI